MPEDTHFKATLLRERVVLTEGSLVERLRRDSDVSLDPQLLHAGLIYSPEGRAKLRSLWRSYLDIGQSYGLPMLIGTPTWRANPERLAASEWKDKDVNGDAVRVAQSVRAEYGDYAGRIFIGGLLACRGDAYKPEEALSADDAAAFHLPQLKALTAAGCDFLHASTLPAFSEALGIARAASSLGVPCVLSFIIQPTGELLDGTPLEEVIRQTDASVKPRPFGYMINCVHPLVCAKALASRPEPAMLVPRRVMGLQANTSRKSPAELEGLDHLDSMDPEEFGKAMLRLHEWFGLKVLGGCCGTDNRHIAAIARRITELYAPPPPEEDDES